MSENGPSESSDPTPPDPINSAWERGETEQSAAAPRSDHDIRNSELTYRELFESTGDAIMLLGKTGFVECNDATLGMFGCRTREEFIAKHPSEVSPPLQPDGTDSRTAAEARMAEALRSGTARFEWLHRRVDGTEFMADVLLARVNLQGRSILQAVVRDISQRKQAEQALRDAQEQLEQRVQERTAELAAANAVLEQEVMERRRAELDLAQERFLLTTLMENAPDFIFFKDAESRFIRVSKALARHYGMSDPTEVVGKSDRDFYAAEQAARYRVDEQEIMRTGRLTIAQEESQISPAGEISWYLTNKVPLYDPTGEIVGTFGISRNITHRKEAEARIEAAMRDAEAASRAKSDFLANMSHEIRTPMNAIIGMTQLVLETTLAETQRDYLQMVRDSSESLLTVINDILDFSKVEAGKLELERTTFDIREVLGDTMKSVGLRAHSKGLELVCEIRPAVPQWLIGDASRLRQIVVNLVGNAIKFTHSGEVLLSVDCPAVEQDVATLHCRVVDSGIGVADEKQAAIFNAFEQADNSTTRQYGGTGLGLAISSRLIEAMGGKIWVESELGCGSTFHFTMRLGIDATAPAPPHYQPARAADSLRVLIVDDNATNRVILSEMLTNWRMQPTAVASASAALAQMREACAKGVPFELVLTDANMPELDGFALARQIKSDPDLSTSVIVMSTSGGRTGDIVRRNEIGITSYLLKPVKQSELFDAIVAALGVNAPADAVEIPQEGVSAGLHRSLSILVAEDSLVNQKLAVGLLEKHGHQVDVAVNGLEAVAAVQSKRYDLVLMDVQMPEMDGFQATHAIRQREAEVGGHLPIVAMTAHAMKGDRQRCLDSGMDGYVAKPIRAAEMFHTIDEVIERFENQG